MKIAQNKAWAATAAAAILIGVSLLTMYLVGTSPFQKRASIDADKVCKSLGEGDEITNALQKTLPDSSSYIFDDTDDVRRDARESSFDSSCFVSAGDKLAVSIRAEMMRADPPNLWLEGVVSDNEDLGARQGVPFPAGDKAVSSERFAAIYVPCVSPGSIPGGSYSLSVVARAPQKSDGSQDSARQGLAELALGMARHVHKQAKCDLPSKLPSEDPKVFGNS